MKPDLAAAILPILLLTLGNQPQAASIDLLPTADGDAQVFGGNNVDTTDDHLAVTQSGGLIRNAIMEFDLSALNDGITVTGASLRITLTRFISVTGGGAAAVDVFAYLGDGAVTIDDFDAAGTQVVDTTTGSAGTGAGDVFVYGFSSVAPIADALAGDRLTLRFETDSFASWNFAALENTEFEPAMLHIEFTPVPVPAGLPLLLSALGLVIIPRCLDPRRRARG